MENDKQRMRQAAAEAFMASLGDFEDMFAESEEKSSPASEKAKVPGKKKEADIFEDALADIEAFMEKRSHPSS